jgi:hypothetical protein
MSAHISIPIHPLAQPPYSSTIATNGLPLWTADNTNEGKISTTAGIWSPLLEDWALSIAPRDQKVMKNKPFYITQPSDKPPGGTGKEVTETDLYLLGAIEKLVYRVDFMEKRLRRTEELLHHVMANSNHNQGKRNSYTTTPQSQLFVLACLFLHTDRSQVDVGWKGGIQTFITVLGLVL